MLIAEVGDHCIGVALTSGSEGPGGGNIKAKSGAYLVLGLVLQALAVTPFLSMRSSEGHRHMPLRMVYRAAQGGPGGVAGWMLGAFGLRGAAHFPREHQLADELGKPTQPLLLGHQQHAAAGAVQCPHGC